MINILNSITLTIAQIPAQPSLTALEKFNRDVTPLIAAGATVVGLLTLVFIWVQLRATYKWNRINMGSNFNDTERITKLTNEHCATCKELGLSPEKNKELTKEEAAKIWANLPARIALTALLNDSELLCGAYRMRCIDPDWAFNIFAARIVQFYSLYKEYINHQRDILKDQTLLIELELTAKEWILMQENSKKKLTALKAKADKKLAALKAKADKKLAAIQSNLENAAGSQKRV